MKHTPPIPPIPPPPQAQFQDEPRPFAGRPFPPTGPPPPLPPGFDRPPFPPGSNSYAKYARSFPPGGPPPGVNTAGQSSGPPPPPPGGAQSPFTTGPHGGRPFHVRGGPPPPPPNPQPSAPWLNAIPFEVNSESTSTSARTGSHHWGYLVIKHIPTINPLRTALFAVLLIIFSLLLSGCTSPSSMNDIYILSLSYKLDMAGDSSPAGMNETLFDTFSGALNQVDKIQEVRVGYLGLCVRRSDDSWTCDSNPSSLVESLRVANQSDPLNLIWVGNRFRTEAISIIFLFICFGFSFFSFVFGILFPLANLSTEWRLGRLIKFVHVHELVADSLTASFFSSASIVGIMCSAFTFAIWQHLVSAASRSMTSNLSFDIVVARTGPEAIALGWLAFVLSMGAMVSLVIENRKMSWSAWLAESETSGTPEERESLNPEGEAEENIEMTENPGLSGWQEPPPTNIGAVLQTMLYLAGQRDPELMMRQRNTAGWARREDNRNQGYAETITDEGSER